jgi:hypothetical protein
MKRGVKVGVATLSLAFFLSPAASGAAAAVLQAKSEDRQTAAVVQSIRRQYAAINKRAGKYKKVQKKLLGFSLEGGELTAYFDGPAVVKIVANHYGEGGRTREEYYYANGKLIFVFQKESRYNRPLSGKVVRTIENRFYFENDRLIRWLGTDGKSVASGSSEYQEKQDEFLDASRKFVDAARSKNSTIEA